MGMDRHNSIKTNANCIIEIFRPAGFILNFSDINPLLLTIKDLP